MSCSVRFGGGLINYAISMSAFLADKYLASSIHGHRGRALQPIDLTHVETEGAEVGGLPILDDPTW